MIEVITLSCVKLVQKEVDVQDTYVSGYVVPKKLVTVREIDHNRTYHYVGYGYCTSNSEKKIPVTLGSKPDTEWFPCLLDLLFDLKNKGHIQNPVAQLTVQKSNQQEPLTYRKPTHKK